MPLVKFSDVKEFVQELEAEPHLVARGIVRVTKLFRPSRLAPNIHHVSVIATARVEEDIVRFERYVGDVWGQGFEENDGKIKDKAAEIQAQLDVGVKSLGLHVRAGELTDEAEA